MRIILLIKIICVICLTLSVLIYLTGTIWPEILFADALSILMLLGIVGYEHKEEILEFIYPDSEPILYDDLPSGSHVYLLKDTSATGYYKIGKTNNLKQRMKVLNNLPFAIELVHVIPCKDAYSMERALHKLFKDKRMNGEWFALEPVEVAFIQQLYDDENLPK